jgi:uncharacterized protein (TIGR02117 family)
MSQKRSMKSLSCRLYLPVLWATVLASCSGKPYLVTETDLVVAEHTQIHVLNHGWHTGVVIPATVLQSRLAPLAARFPRASYLEIGWGDAGFYQAKEITSALTLRAIFWPTDSVVHVVGFDLPPAHYFPDSESIPLCLKPEQMALLLQFISDSFALSAEGSLQSLDKGIYGDSQFYRGEGDYSLFNTCNTWTAKGLKSAGLDLCPTFKLTASSVLSSLKSVGSVPVSGQCEQGQSPPVREERFLGEDLRVD